MAFVGVGHGGIEPGTGYAPRRIRESRAGSGTWHTLLTVDSAPESGPPPDSLLTLIANLAASHREHEKFYSQAPLRQAIELESHSRVLKALAAHWATAEPSESPLPSPFAGAEDLNAPGLTAEAGVLFMEGEGEPAEVARLKRDLALAAADLEQSGEWLRAAMEQSWGVAGALAQYPQLAGVLGERHRIIANDWQSAGLQELTARLLRRALDLLGQVEFTPAALRADLSGERRAGDYLFSASELIDRAADLLAESATLVHENERRWRAFSTRVGELSAG